MILLVAGMVILAVGISAFAFGVVAYTLAYELVSSGKCKLIGSTESTTEDGWRNMEASCGTDLTQPVIFMIVGLACIAGGVVGIAKSRKTTTVARR
jgi:amino acid transporter